MCGTISLSFGPCPLYPTIVDRDLKFYEGKKFKIINGQITYQDKLFTGRIFHCRFSELWDMCFQEISKVITRSQIDRLESLSILNTNLHMIQTLCKKNRQFNYGPLKEACNLVLDDVEKEYSSYPMNEIENIAKTLDCVRKIFSNQETEVIRERFHELVNKDINTCFDRLQQISQNQKLSNIDRSDLKRYSWGVKKLPDSSFSERYVEINQVLQICLKNLEVHNKIREEKKAREEVASKKAKMLVSKMEPNFNMLFNLMPSLTNYLANDVPVEISSEMKAEVKMLLESSDLNDEEKYNLSNAYTNCSNKISNFYLSQLNNLNGAYLSHYPEFMESWLYDAESISERKIEEATLTQEVRVAFADFVQLKLEATKELEKYFYRLKIKKTDHKTLLKDLCDAKNIKNLENFEASDFEASDFEIPKDSSDTKNMLLLFNVKEFREKLQNEIYNPLWSDQLDQFRQEVKDQMESEEKVTKLNRSLVLHIVRMQRIIEERKNFDEMWRFVINMKKTPNRNPDEINACHSIVNEFKKMRLVLPKVLLEKHQIDNLLNCFS